MASSRTSRHPMPAGVELPKLSQKEPVQSTKRVPRTTGLRSMVEMPTKNPKPPKGAKSSQVTINSGRVRDPGRDNVAASMDPNLVQVYVDVSVQSIDFSRMIEGPEEMAQTYVQAMLGFVQLVVQDYAGALSQAEQGLYESYGCTSARVNGQANGGLRFRLSLPRSRLVSLQCEQSSGQLAKDLQQWLTIPGLLKQIGAQEITLATEIAS